jgi:septum formation protein
MNQLTHPCFVLASASPRRRELLAIFGLPFTVVRPGQEIDETPLPGEKPAALVQRLSRLKAKTALAELPPLAALSFSPPIDDNVQNRVIVIAADTDVALDEEILGKPAGPAEATLMLQRLRGRCHHVYSGLTIAALTGASNDEPVVVSRLHQSQVWMRAYTEAEIAAYVARGSPLDKAGAYGIQDDPFNPVDRLEGCYASVMGLPLGELADALQEMGVELPPVGPRCAGYTGRACCQF